MGIAVELEKMDDSIMHTLYGLIKQGFQLVRIPPCHGPHVHGTVKGRSALMSTSP